MTVNNSLILLLLEASNLYFIPTVWKSFCFQTVRILGVTVTLEYRK